MLYDHAGRLLELAHQLQGGVCINDVVVRQLLALQHAGGRDRGAFHPGGAVEGRALVRVLAVAQTLHPAPLLVNSLTEVAVLVAPEVIGDHAVVGRRGAKGSRRQPAPGSVGHAAGLADLGQDDVVVVRVNHYGNVGVILGRRAKHRRAAYVDILYGLLEAAVTRGDLGEGVEVDAHKIDVLQVVFLDLLAMRGVLPARQYAAVHAGVQRLDAPIEDLGTAGVLADVDHLEAGVAQCPGRSARGEDLYAQGGKSTAELHHAGFVANADQRRAYLVSIRLHLLFYPLACCLHFACSIVDVSHPYSDALPVRPPSPPAHTK